ncbi:NAC domain containing protein 16, putative isoform 5 [Hibiscus syriacus]|uniref:NAC domain containing protein 16, putative isoform 5 n=1 Tax=Hibiscus syriacus TaxID=106335 RepID=A0A6A2WX02_HIBSY|nr:NAC domain containing protein 16, putative isoform 5 [Hibiscus syriacus]
MHEYTLDEEELKRCQTAKDYYALYKLYKKSGPGPKNGEQYGAPFKEEEWADEEYTSEPVDAITPVKQPYEAIHDDDEKANDQIQPPLNDIEKFMRQFADEIVLPHPQAHFDYVLPRVVHDHASFEFSQSPTSHLQLREAPEVTSVADPIEQLPQICDKDFLEIDDLLNSDILTSNVEKPVENGQQFNELDGLAEFELYHDAAMFLQDIGPIEQRTVPFSCAENMINQVNYQLEPQSIISLMDPQLQPQLNAFRDNILNQVDYQLPFQSFGNELEQPLQMDQTNGSIWTPDQSGDVFTPSGSNLGNASPTSGLMYSVNNLDQGEKNSGGGASRFSSVLWSFVESIPTSSASASESPLVNRALERMSSFSRLRTNSRNTNAGRTGRNKGFFFISMFGALFAILWFLTGTVRVLGCSMAS